MTKDSIIFVSLIAGAFCISLGCYEYNKVKGQEIDRKNAENEKIYFEKLTPEQVERLEKEKLEVKREAIERDERLEKERIEVKKREIELKMQEAELKKTVADFKNDIQQQVEKETMIKIHDDMRDTFDNWSAKFETRLENKIDNVVTRIDNLSDKYGGVKEINSVTPSINVVNAPNN